MYREIINNGLSQAEIDAIVNDVCKDDKKCPKCGEIMDNDYEHETDHRWVSGRSCICGYAEGSASPQPPTRQDKSCGSLDGERHG